MIYKINSFLFLLSCFLCSQTIEIEHESNFSYVTDAAHMFYGQLINNSDEDIEIDVIRKEITLPKGWETSYCVGNCYPPIIDSVRVIIKAGESLPNFTMDFLEADGEEAEEGIALGEIVIRNRTNKSEQSIPFGVLYSKEEVVEPQSISIDTPYEVSLSSGATFSIKVAGTTVPDISLEYLTDQDTWELVTKGKKEESDTVTQLIQCNAMGTNKLLLKINCNCNGEVLSSLVWIQPTKTNNIAPQIVLSSFLFNEIGTYRIETFLLNGQKLKTQEISSNGLHDFLKPNAFTRNIFLKKVITPSGKTLKLKSVQ